MKRIISVLAICAVLCGLFAGCGSRQSSTTDTHQTTPSSTLQGPPSALAALEGIWNLFAEDEKFWVVGGSNQNSVDNGPGSVALTDTDYLTASLLIPQAQLGSITEAASMVHAMNANNFSCGVYKVADVRGFADVMDTTLENHQWICGMPELVKIVDLGGGYVLVAFGVGDAMTPFFRHLATAYPQAVTLVEENVA